MYDSKLCLVVGQNKTLRMSTRVLTKYNLTFYRQNDELRTYSNHADILIMKVIHSSLQLTLSAMKIFDKYLGLNADHLTCCLIFKLDFLFLAANIYLPESFAPNALCVKVQTFRYNIFMLHCPLYSV